MKTPRDLFLERHRAATPRLDRIRNEVLASELTEKGRTEPEPQGAGSADRSPAWMAQTVWHELVRPCRLAWTGLAAVWLLVLGLNIAAPNDPRTLAHAPTPPAPEVLATLREQSRMLTELLDSGVAPETTSSEPTAPERRSDRRLQPAMGCISTIT
jgi:hypothetical protein